MTKTIKKNAVIALILAIILMLPFFGPRQTEGETQSYVSGDALNYRGADYITSANSGIAELFKIENNATIKKITQIKAAAENNSNDGFIDAVLNLEDGGFFWFLTDGKYVYKYDINNPSNPVLLKRVVDQAGGIFTGLDRIGSKVYSISSQGINVWDDNLNIFYNANLTNYIPRNIKLAKNANYIFNINGDKLEIYSGLVPNLSASVSLAISDNHARNMYVDETNNTVYVVDDQAVKQFNFSGTLLNSFKHTSKQGYDIAYAPGDNYLYFSDGIGVVKLSKKDLKPVKWVYTKEFSDSEGWATGLKVFWDDYGEKIVVFNNSSITILNQDLKKVGSIKMPHDDITHYVAEGLLITLSSHNGSSGSDITVSGRGYDPSENLSIYFADQKIGSAQADNNGRFSRAVQMPYIKTITADIRVVGDISGKHYSTNFQLDGINYPGNLDRNSLLIALDNYEVLPGAEITIKGQGYNPNEYVLIYADFDKISVVKADSNGRFTQLVKIPENKSGKIEIRAFGYDSAKSYTINLIVKNNNRYVHEDENIHHWTKGHTR